MFSSPDGYPPSTAPSLVGGLGAPACVQAGPAAWCGPPIEIERPLRSGSILVDPCGQPPPYRLRAEWARTPLARFWNFGYQPDTLAAIVDALPPYLTDALRRAFAALQALGIRYGGPVLASA